MSFTEIKYDVADKVATLTLNRPDKLNAFTGVMMMEMIKAFDMADADDNVRAVVVTGSGRGFCAGADLQPGAKTFDYKSRSDRPEKAGVPMKNGEVDWSHEGVRDGGGRVTLRIFECLKPVIGAINGPAVGIGVTMQLPMDIRIASENARFGFVFARRGIVPEACSSWFLPRLVGISQAMEWCATGRVFDAQEALRGGIGVEGCGAGGVVARGLRDCARDRGQHSAGVGGAHAADDVAHARCRSSDGRATRSTAARSMRAGGKAMRKKAWCRSSRSVRRVSRQGVEGHAFVLSVVGQADVFVVSQARRGRLLRQTHPRGGSPRGA